MSCNSGISLTITDYTHIMIWCCCSDRITANSSENYFEIYVERRWLLESVAEVARINLWLEIQGHALVKIALYFFYILFTFYFLSSEQIL